MEDFSGFEMSGALETSAYRDHSSILAEEFLVSARDLRPPPGLPTGVEVFDDFLLWKGLPQGDISLFYGRPGAGATSLWLQAVKQAHAQPSTNSGWAAWINSDWELMPNQLLQNQIDLRRLLVVNKPKEAKNFFAILQELIASGIFTLVGCHLPETSLKNHQLQKLKRLARVHKVALVLISHARQWVINPLFSLVIDCAREFFTIRRALHRPTPFSVEGKLVYANLGLQISPAAKPFLR